MDHDHCPPLTALRAILGTAATGVPLTGDEVTASRLSADRFPQVPKENVWELWSALAEPGSRPSLALETLYATGWSVNFPALHHIRGIEQSPLWHPEGTVDIHSGLAADAAVGIVDCGGYTPDQRVIIVLGALLHDVGKATHTFQSPDGSISCRGHARAGVTPAREFLNAIGAPAHITEAILRIIATHMDARAGGNATGPTSTQLHRLLQRLNGTPIEAWAAVIDADVTGRGTGNRPPEGHLWVEAARLRNQPRTSSALLRGGHLAERGFPEGTVRNHIITTALHAQENGDFNDVPGALSWLERHGQRLTVEDARIQAARPPRIKQQKRRRPQ